MSISPWVLIIGTAVAAIVGALLYWLIQGRKDWKNEPLTSTLIFRTLLFASILGGFAFLLLQGYGEESNFTLLRYWRRADEFGYVVIIMEMVKKGAPFFLMGLFLPFAYNKINRVSMAALIGFASAIIIGLLRAILGSFNWDEMIYAFAFLLAGFCFTTLLAWIFPNREIFKRMGFAKKTHLFGVPYLFVVYFSFMMALILNNGTGVGTLRLPAMSQPLPEAIVNQANLSGEKGKVETFEARKPKLEEDANRIAAALGMAGSAKIEELTEWDIENKREAQNAIVTDGAKTLTYNVSGYWQYNDTEAEASQAPASDDEICIAVASDLAASGIAPGYTVQEARVESTVEDENGTIVQKQIYITAKYGGLNVLIGGDFFVNVGANGAICSIRKYDPDFEVASSVKIISTKEAYSYVEKYLAGEELPDHVSVSHTLYQPATDMTINRVDLAYWLEEAKGLLLPVWVFSGEATMSDGTVQKASVYVTAKA